VAISSSIVEEHKGHGKGHTDHGNGKGPGHQKHAEKAMADGVYEMEVFGINHDNPTAVDQATPQTTLADGTKMNTEVRGGIDHHRSRRASPDHR
jgi:hypothetical protein